jgi:hypothetical protein
MGVPTSMGIVVIGGIVLAVVVVVGVVVAVVLIASSGKEDRRDH